MEVHGGILPADPHLSATRASPLAYVRPTGGSPLAHHRITRHERDAGSTLEIRRLSDAFDTVGS
jgi:hypothetical protein